MIKIDISDFTLVREGHPDVRTKRPCSLFEVMQGIGEIPDVYYRDNIKRVSSDFSPCSFVSTLKLEDATVAMKHVYLTFSRIYADAEVYLNGKRYRRVHNYNRIYTVEVSDSVRAGDNVLEIRCNKPLAERKIIGTGSSSALEYELSPYLADVGIIGECSLIATNFAMIDKISVRQKHSEGRVDVEVSLETIGACENMRAVATLISPAGRMYFGSINDGVGSITVTSPELWWPRGLGSPSLYRLTVSLYCNEALEDMREIMIGMREISLVTDSTDGAYMTVNGVRFLPMGATYVREDSVIPFITEDRLLRMISSSSDANMNTLRLVGDGLYPDNRFYELCDEYGIMVWQDISVSYIKPPVAETFSAGVYSELCDIMSRISHHASVVLMYLMINERADSDSPASDASLREFVDVCYHIAQPIAERFACGIPFIMARETLEDADESSMLDEINIIRDACFASLPPKSSVMRFAEPEDLNLLSPVMESHTSGNDSIAKMLVNMSSAVRYPYDFDTLIYATQITSGYSVFRSVSRARLKSGGKMTAVCRQLNDSWPSISAASVDFYGRRKALHYYSKRAFSPIFVGADIKGNEVEIGVSNDTQRELEATLLYALYDVEGNCHYENKRELTVSPNSKSDTLKYDFSSFIGDRVEDFYLVLELHGKGRRLFRSILLFTSPKRLSLRKPNISADIVGEGTRYEMLLRSDTLALACEVSFDGIDADMSDNYVNVSGDFYEKITIETEKETNATELKEKLRIISVYDIGR